MIASTFVKLLLVPVFVMALRRVVFAVDWMRFIFRRVLHFRLDNQMPALVLPSQVFLVWMVCYLLHLIYRLLCMHCDWLIIYVFTHLGRTLITSQ